MYARWPCFEVKLDNDPMAVARTDVGIAAEYASLVDPELRERFLPHLEAAYDQAVSFHGDVTGHDGLHRRDWLAEASADGTRASTRCTCCRSNCSRRTDTPGSRSRRSG